MRLPRAKKTRAALTALIILAMCGGLAVWFTVHKPTQLEPAVTEDTSSQSQTQQTTPSQTTSTTAPKSAQITTPAVSPPVDDIDTLLKTDDVDKDLNSNF